MKQKKGKWPKKIPELSEKQKSIREDFMKYWHEVLPNKYQFVERFSQVYPVKNCRKTGRVLEIGAGLGEHISYEDLSRQEYFALELRPKMAEVIKNRFPEVKVVVSDCQKKIDFPNGYFDKILAIHILEHLPLLPATLKEVHRLLKPDGEFCVVLPCEGGFLYSLARKVTTQRIFKKRYNMKMNWLVKSEHVNEPREVAKELKKFFHVSHRSFYPFKIPAVNLNLVLGLVLKPKSVVE